MFKGRKAWFIRRLLAFFVVCLVGLVALVALVTVSPGAGAQGADFLRNLLGPKFVANMEAVILTVQDFIHQVAFKVEKATPSAPWQIPFTQEAALQSTMTIMPSKTSTLQPFSTITLLPTLGMTPQLTALTATSTPTSTPAIWKPDQVPPLGLTPGEGIWIPHIWDSSANIVAYKTYLQPDPERPYVTVGIVAFDLTHVRLHYLLGTDEPQAPDQSERSGEIPWTHRQPGILLAAFNGGFKTINGHFGVIVNGHILIPMINNMGTVVIYKDGRVTMGEWGVDLTYTTDMVVVRQNCPLMVKNGEINPLVFNNSVNDWGGTFGGNIVTFRSGIGISQDGKTLYYFAGQSLTMPSLARSMQVVGAYQAMQLDINDYYVLFTKFELQDHQLVGVPLLPKDMNSNVSRFLGSYYRDFFYITATDQ